MKLTSSISFFFLLLAIPCIQAQEATAEKYGKTLNVEAGVGYYRYVGYLTPVFCAGFEMQIDKNLTAAPSISTYSYHNSFLWGDKSNAYKKYNYSESVTVIAIKVFYYFDEILKAGSNWDFYAAGSLGCVLRKTKWETAYGGKNQIEPGMGPLYLNFHIGSEYHLTEVIGLQIDLSAGFSTIGLAVHL